jgi:hypothetical protein
MIFLFKYFWFFFNLVPLFYYIKLKKIYYAEMTEDEKYGFSKFVKHMSIYLISAFSTLGIIQLSGQYEAPDFIYRYPFDNIHVLFSYIVTLIAYAIYIYWLWFKGGGEILSKYRKVLPAFRDERYTKIVHTFTLVALLIINLIFFR